MVRSDQRHEKRSQKSKTLNYSGSLDSLGCALEGTGADVFRVSPSGGVFVVFVVFFFCVVSQKESGRDPRIDTRRFVSRERIKWKDPMGSDSGLKKKSRKTRRTMTVPVPARHLATDDDLFFRRPAEEAAAAVVLNDFGSRVLAADAATESIMVCGRPQ